MIASSIMENGKKRYFMTFEKNNHKENRFGLKELETKASISSNVLTTSKDEEEIKAVECQMQGGTWKFGTCVFDYGFGETVEVIAACPACKAAEEAHKQAGAEFMYYVLDKSWAQLDALNERNFGLFAFGKGKYPFKNYKPDRMQEVKRLLPKRYEKFITNMPGEPIKPINPKNAVTKEGTLLINLWKLIINILKTKEFVIPVIFVPTPEMIYLYDKEELKI